jgi:hypothetical protein
MKIVTHLLACTALSFVVASAYGTPGQPGTLDTSWGPNGNGQTITDIGGMSDSVFAMALQPNGKAVVSGVCQSGINLGFARYGTTLKAL